MGANQAPGMEDLRWLLEQMHRRGSMSVLTLARATKIHPVILRNCIHGGRPIPRHVMDVLATYFSLVECVEAPRSTANAAIKTPPLRDARRRAFPETDWAKWLNDLMEKANVTEAEVAEDNDLSLGAVHRLRRGGVLPNADMYLRLDAYFKAIDAMTSAANRPEPEGDEE